MTKERLAEAIKVGFAQGRGDYTANINVHHIDAETFEIMVVSETSPLVVLGEFKDWMALAFVRQILMFGKFAPGILAVVKGRSNRRNRGFQNSGTIFRVIW